MIYVTRRSQFSAAHRLFNPSFSADRNDMVFDKCNNIHGHNYTLDVTVKGLPDPETGYVIDLKILRDIIEAEIIEKVDHKNLNVDVEFLDGLILTAEHLAVTAWRILEKKIPAGALHCVKLFESENNFVEYRGEPVTLHRFHTQQFAEKA